jgi:hypothetical protein
MTFLKVGLVNFHPLSLKTLRVGQVHLELFQSFGKYINTQFLVLPLNSHSISDGIKKLLDGKVILISILTNSKS